MKRYSFLVIAITAFIFRLSLLFIGYHGDLNNQISWGKLITERGTVNFYEGNEWPYSAPNQPPLTILLLGLMSLLWNVINVISWSLNNTLTIFPSGFIWFWEGRGIIFIMKLPSILADLGIGWLIYTFFKEKKEFKKAIVLASVWLFNPIVWYNSSVWGQTDSIVNLLGLLSVLSLLKKRLAWSTFWFTLSLLFKGSLSYFAPIFLAVSVYQKYSLKEWFISFVTAVLPITFVSLLFHPSIDFPLWLYNLYTNRFIPGEIGYLTANALNFWWLVDSGKTYDSILFFGMPARFWGFLLPFAVIALNLWNLRKGVTDKKLFFALALTALTIFLFMTRIHERYLYPFFPYATLLLGYVPLVWLVYIPLSIIHLLNLYNLFWVPSIPVLESLLKNGQVTNILSLTSLLSLPIFFLALKGKRKRI